MCNFTIIYKCITLTGQCLLKNQLFCLYSFLVDLHISLSISDKKCQNIKKAHLIQNNLKGRNKPTN